MVAEDVQSVMPAEQLVEMLNQNPYHGGRFFSREHDHFNSVYCLGFIGGRGHTLRNLIEFVNEKTDLDMELFRQFFIAQYNGHTKDFHEMFDKMAVRKIAFEKFLKEEVENLDGVTYKYKERMFFGKVGIKKFWRENIYNDNDETETQKGPVQDAAALPVRP